jgi:hypothetical protein
VLMSFKRNGELFGQPRITFQSSDASDAERASYRTAVVETLKRCASLPFTGAFGNGMAGEPFTMRFVDDRERPPPLVPRTRSSRTPCGKCDLKPRPADRDRLISRSPW